MKRSLAILSVAILVGVLIPAAGCSKKGEAEPAQATAVVQGVPVIEVVKANIPDAIEAVGTVKAKNSALIAARIPGTVTSVLIREGERVPRGKLLVTLMATESTAGAAGAVAAEEEAKRAVDEAVARKKLADVTFERYGRLLKEQAVTQQEFDGKQMEKEVADQGVERARARLVQAREGANASRAVAGYTRISAPLNGIVVGKSVDVGMTVFPGMPLMTVEEEGRYHLEVNAPASLLGKVKVGDKAQVALQDMAETTGRVTEVIPSADPVTRTFPVKVEVTAGGIRSGVYGSAFFSVGDKQGIAVPKTAIVEHGALTSVWVVNSEMIARMRLVKTGRSRGGLVEILSGIAPGERIVAAGVDKVTDGVRIQ